MQRRGALRLASGWLAAALIAAAPGHALAEGPQALTQAYNASG